MSTAREIDLSIGKIIKLHRQAVDLTQNNLAHAIGISFQQVQKYEAGTNRVSVSRLFAIAEALHVAPAHLIALVQDDIGYESPGTGIENLKELDPLFEKNAPNLTLDVRSLKNTAVSVAFAKLLYELQNCSASEDM